jgi:hypothetical protein
MSKKTYVIIFIVMLLSAVVAVAQPFNKTTLQTLSHDEVPIWYKDETWTYKIDDLTMDLSDDNKSIYLSVSVEELPLTVTDATGEYYTVAFDTSIDGQGHIIINDSNGPINISITINDLQLTGSLLVDKTTLGLTGFSFAFTKQKVNFNIIDQPFFPLPAFLQNLTIRFTTDVDTTADTSIGLLTFPINTGTIWNQSAVNITATGKVESRVFNLIYFINKIAKIFHREFLPVEIENLLPIIDISEALNTFLGGNVIFIPALTNVFYCLNTETITVPAGIYQAYNITLFEGAGQCYYAPDAKNVIRLFGYFEGIMPFVKNIDMELLSAELQ